MRTITCTLLVTILSFFCANPLPAQTALEALEQTLDSEKEQGYLGLTAENVDGLTSGVRVLTVLKGAAAESGGLQPGDIINAVNGVVIRNMDTLGRSLANTHTGTKLSFTISRNTKRLELPVTLGSRPATAPVPNSEAVPLPPAPRQPSILSPAPARQRATLGVRVVSPTERRQPSATLGITRGAVIYSIHPGSAAARHGLPLGGVIVAVDGRRISSPTDLVRELSTARVGQTVELNYYLGLRQYRKRVTLGPEVAAPATGEQPLVLRPETPPVGRSPLEELERRLTDNPPTPPGFETRVPAPVPSGPTELNPPLAPAPPAVDKSELSSLRKEVGELKTRIAELEKLVSKLTNAEKKSTSVSPALPDPASP